MSISFYSNETVDNSEPVEVQHTDESQITTIYEVDRCISWIKLNKYEKVCLQFPDTLLADSVSVASAIECGIGGQKVFICGDTSYGSCCVDFLTASHIDADAIIHFGRACLTSFLEIPVLYVFPKESLNVSTLYDGIHDLLERISELVILLYDVAYMHYVDEIRSKESFNYRVVVSMLQTPDNKFDYCTYCRSVKTCGCKSFKKFGRYYNIPSDTTAVSYVYVVSDSYETNFENFIISDPESTFYRYSSGHLSTTSVPVAIKRRLYEVERVKEARRVGILVATLATDAYVAAIDRARWLCERRGKRSYVIAVGKLNPAKLANLPEIDVFVAISCPEFRILNKEEFYQPIYTMNELELALNDEQQWNGKVESDFREFLPGGSEYKELSNHIVENTDVSLLSNNLRSAGMSDTVEGCQDLVAKELHVGTNHIRDGLAGRSWRGLELEVSNKDVEKAQIGRKGTPSTGYIHPTTDRLT